MRRGIGCAVALTVGLVLPVAASANVLYEDVIYWRPDGSSEIDPAVPPIDAYVKIQQTVYDDTQGRALLQAQLDGGFAHGNGGVIPAYPLNLYAYSITNLNYGNGPFTGTGAGVQGFVIPDVAGVGGVMYGPTAANDYWEVGTGHIGPGFWEWDIDDDNDHDNGDGFGVLQGQTFNSFMLVVPDGTTHGFIPNAWVHSWHGAGLLEKSSGAGQIDLVFGVVSGPVPEPATLGLLTLGGLALLRRRSR